MATGRSLLRRKTLQLSLAASQEKASERLPQLALEGPPACRPTIHSHNVALIRWIFEEARALHLERPEYQARQGDQKPDKCMRGVILQEVCLDVLKATRHCCQAYRAIESLNEAAHANSHPSYRNKMQKVRRKLFVASALARMLCTIRENNSNAELMWKDCCAGLWSSSLSSKAFASRSITSKAYKSQSLDVRSFQPCGSISLALRRFRRGAPNNGSNA